MEYYFSVNAFYLGILTCACLCFTNLAYSLFFIFKRIKILVFAVFNKLWFWSFSLHTETVGSTKFELGWLPWSAYIKPEYRAAEEKTVSENGQSESAIFFANQPKYQKVFFNLIPTFTYALAFIIAFFCFADLNNLGSVAKSIANYVIEAFSAMFSGNVAKYEFANTTKAICEGKNVVAFGFLMLTLLMILTIPISGFLSEAMSKKSKILQGLSVLYFLGYLWVLLWKIPQFVFSFFTLRQSLVYFSSFLIGMYLMGFSFYFSSLYLFKKFLKPKWQ